MLGRSTIEHQYNYRQRGCETRQASMKGNSRSQAGNKRSKLIGGRGTPTTESQRSHHAHAYTQYPISNLFIPTGFNSMFHLCTVRQTNTILLCNTNQCIIRKNNYSIVLKYLIPTEVEKHKQDCKTDKQYG